jgi:predicted aspartyl protease
MEAEMFLKANVQGSHAHLLIDTGATLTLVSTALAEKIVNTTMPINAKESV